MSAIEWVSLCEAVARLQNLWGIHLSIAEGIVRSVLQGGEVEVRGVARDQLVPQIITEQIRSALRSALFPNFLGSLDWRDIEIDWNGLVKHGRKLVPRWINVTEPPVRPKGSSRQRVRAARARDLAAQVKLKKQERGPKRGETGFQASDRKLFSQISEKIKNGKARSPYGAALLLADQIAGDGTPGSKARRISALYRKERGGWPETS